MAGGIAAYKAVELLRRLTEAGHDVSVRADPAALQFVGEPTWAALSHHPVTSEVWDRRARGAARGDRAPGRAGGGRPGHRRPAGQGGARAGRRPAHQYAADRPLPGAVRAGHAHRDVGAPRHRGQRGHPARPGCDRAGARLRPVDRHRHRAWSAAGAGRDRRAGRAAAAPPGRAAAGSRRSPAADHRRRHPRAAGSGAFPRQPFLRPAGFRPGLGGRRPRRPGHPDRGQRRAAARPPPPSWSRSAPPSSCARPPWPRPRTPTWW